MSLFKRNLTLTIGSEDEAIVVTEPINIRATIVKDIKSGEKDYASVTIINLSKGTRDALNTQYKEIEIKAGYAEESDICFVGSVISATHTHEGTEWITTIECGDGIEVLDQALINKTYEKGFTLGDVLKDFAAISDISLGDILEVDTTKALSRGKSFSTDVQAALNELGKTNNFDWSIQDGKLVVVGTGKSRVSVTRVIGARSGMVGSPEWINTGADAAKTNPITGTKFKVNSLCIPSLKPADMIIVRSESLSGRIGSYNYNIKRPESDERFSVTKVQHDLDNRAGNFITQIECVSQAGG